MTNKVGIGIGITAAFLYIIYQNKTYRAESFEAEREIKKDGCCCGATIENPCECMYEGIMECSSVEPKCLCYAAKDAESFEAERKPNQCMHCNEVLYEIEVWEDFRCPHCNNSIGDIYSDEISYDDYMSAESFEVEGECKVCGERTTDKTTVERIKKYMDEIQLTDNEKNDRLCEECFEEYIDAIRFYWSAESFEADDTKYADIEMLLESDEDVFLGTGDGFKPDHPQKERIIEYLTQGGGGQTPYRVCFTCSVVTPDWLLINEGYECMPCSEINRTDYEKRKWGSDAESFEAEKIPMPKLVGWEESDELGGHYGALGRPIITVQYTIIGPRGGKTVQEVTYEANSKHSRMVKNAESFDAESSVRTGMVGNTEYHWYVDGDETIKDREGEPLINRRMEDEIDDDIQHNIKIFLERGEKKGEAYHEVDDLHDRFDEPQSYGIFYSWGAESFGADEGDEI